MRILTALPLIVLGTLAVHAQPRTVQPTWSFDLAGTVSMSDAAIASHISNTAWSSTGKCVAVSTADTVNVIDTAGALIWTWQFGRTNRLVRANLLAVSPSCDLVAIGGDSDYKYVWIAQRRGARMFFKTSGTPWAVRFSLAGDVVAVTTGASRGYLLSRRAEVLWSGPDRGLPVRWPSRADALEQTAPSETRGRRIVVRTPSSVRVRPGRADASISAGRRRWISSWRNSNRRRVRASAQ